VLPVPGLFHDGGTPDEESPPIDTIAIGGFITTSKGDLPFFRRPTLGGRNTLRGYIQNRFTDKSAWHAGVEYRFWFLPRGVAFTPSIRFERLGLALFAEAGSVGDGVGDLFDSRVLSSYGGSFRTALERQAHFRLDVGFSKEDVNVVFAYGYSF
jgi:outer membrane protein assembly factor BamA